MKKILILTLVLMLLFTIGCIPKREEMSPMEEISNAEKLLKGEHILRKVYSSEENQTNSKGSFFIFFGSYNSEKKPTMVVQFAWKMNHPDNSMYAISSLPSTKIRVNFNENIEYPTIKFKWTSSDSKDIQQLMDNNVLYAVITIREKDWPIDIKLPMNEKTS